MCRVSGYSRGVNWFDDGHQHSVGEHFGDEVRSMSQAYLDNSFPHQYLQPIGPYGRIAPFCRVYRVVEVVTSGSRHGERRNFYMDLAEVEQRRIRITRRAKPWP